MKIRPGQHMFWGFFSEAECVSPIDFPWDGPLGSTPWYWGSIVGGINRNREIL